MSQSTKSKFASLYVQSNIYTKSKQNGKIFYCVNQGPKGQLIDEKTRGQKSRDTVSFRATFQKNRLLVLISLLF
jgi:hypothetical protein